MTVFCGLFITAVNGDSQEFGRLAAQDNLPIYCPPHDGATFPAVLEARDSSEAFEVITALESRPDVVQVQLFFEDRWDDQGKRKDAPLAKHEVV